MFCSPFATISRPTHKFTCMGQGRLWRWGRGGILISWVTAVALGLLDQPRLRAGRGAVSFYVGRKEGKVQHRQPQPDSTRWLLCLKRPVCSGLLPVRTHSEMMLTVGKEGGAGMEMTTLLPLNMQHGLGSREPVETHFRWAPMGTFAGRNNGPGRCSSDESKCRPRSAAASSWISIIGRKQS